MEQFLNLYIKRSNNSEETLNSVKTIDAYGYKLLYSLHIQPTLCSKQIGFF